MVVLSYIAYLLISIGITIWVARTLSTNGEIFLIECFGHNERIAKSTNHLLVIGFYLINIGYIAFTLQFGSEPKTTPEAIRFLSTKCGLAVLVLGVMHFINMGMITTYGRKLNTLISGNVKPASGLWRDSSAL